MSLYTIKNDVLSAEIESFGAELRSLKDSTGKNYMWCADPEYWGRVSPILFPFIGKTYNSEYHLDGKAYPMTAHGFARDMDFSLKSHTESEIWFSLSSNEQTLSKFPFEFNLEIGYKLCKNSIEVLWRVNNPSDIDLPFTIGGHPAFNCPLNGCENQSEYYLHFDTNETLLSTAISAKGLKLPEKTAVNTENGYIHITKELIDLQTVLLENSQCKQISLCTPDRKPYITVDFDAPVVALWTPSDKQSAFFCIEPWYGVCDSEGYTGELKDRPFQNMLHAKEIFNASYKITVNNA